MGFGAILNCENVAKVFKLEQIIERGLSFLVWSSAVKDVMSEAVTVLRCSLLYYQGDACYFNLGLKMLDK